MITCTFEDNGEAQLRHVTVNAIVMKDSMVLLAKRGTYNGGKPLLESGKWSLIGGFLSRDETLEEGLRREVREESGWEIDNLRLFHIKDSPGRRGEDRQNVGFVYVVDAVIQRGESDEEVQEMSWYAFDQLPPADQIAFDHGDDLALYQKYLKTEFPLPVIGK